MNLFLYCILCFVTGVLIVLVGTDFALLRRPLRRVRSGGVLRVRDRNAGVTLQIPLDRAPENWDEAEPVIWDHVQDQVSGSVWNQIAAKDLHMHCGIQVQHRFHTWADETNDYVCNGQWPTA